MELLNPYLADSRSECVIFNWILIRVWIWGSKVWTWASESGLGHRVSGIGHPKSGHEHQSLDCGLRHRVSGLGHPKSGLGCPKSGKTLYFGLCYSTESGLGSPESGQILYSLAELEQNLDRHLDKVWTWVSRVWTWCPTNNHHQQAWFILQNIQEYAVQCSAACHGASNMSGSGMSDDMALMIASIWCNHHQQASHFVFRYLHNMANQDLSIRTTSSLEGQDRKTIQVCFQEPGKRRPVWEYIFVLSLIIVVSIVAFFAGRNYMPQGLCYKQCKLK